MGCSLSRSASSRASGSSSWSTVKVLCCWRCYHGKPIGGVLYLRWKDTLYYKFNASDPSWLEFRPNDFLVWEGIKMARDQGLRLFDFGLSDYEQEGLVRYKRKYASEEEAVDVVRSMDPGSDGEIRKVLGNDHRVVGGRVGTGRGHGAGRRPAVSVLRLNQGRAREGQRRPAGVAVSSPG